MREFGETRTSARRTAAAGLLVLTASLTLAACDGGRDGTPSFPARQVVEPDPALGVGSVSGTVYLDGVVPKPRKLRAPHALCGEDGHVIVDESFVVADGLLANTLVYVKTGLEDYTFDYDRSEARIDQKMCVFVPHVAAVRAYQPVRFVNSDRLNHNINCTTSDQGFTATISPGTGSVVRQFERPETGIRVTCDLHANMLMYVHVIDHPFFAVTGPEGTFELNGLPPGAYVLAAVHERLGEQLTNVIVKAGRTATADLRFRR